MEFMNEYNSEIGQSNLNTSSKNQQLFETDESEFDEFEHHLSQYENKDEELFNDDDSIMDHDGRLINVFKSQDDESQESQHQISLATSFCRNTQEPNDNFLDDNINGDLLFDHFNEDKYIKCKYSEDFYYEQQNLQSNKLQQNQLTPLIDEIETDHQSINQNEQDKHTEERSSEDEVIIEKRKRHFLEFISTIPKVCTPSVCGTLSQRTLSSEDQIDGEHPDLKTNNQVINLMSRLTEENEEILFNDDDEFDEHGEENHKFDWSIDQLATLRPVDISFNERRLLRFKDFESDQLTQEKLTKENDQFFSQEAIAPSPNKRVSFKNIGQEFMNSECDIDRQILDDKDSGNYSNEDDNLEFTDSKINQSNKNRSKRLTNNLEFSFNENSNQRLSDIEFDIGYKHHQTNTPSRKSFGIRNKNKNQLNEWTTNLDFQPHSHLQTSTPCTSFSRFQQINAISNYESEKEKLERQEQSINHPCKDLCNCKKLNQNENDKLIFQSNQFDQKKLPLQEKSSMKQKKKLFHNFTMSNEQTKSSSSSLNTNDSSANNNSSNNSSSNSSSTNKRSSTDSINDDEGICESSKEITFGSSSSMSACNNNLLTPKPKKLRNSIMKSFAQRLDEIELFGNDENNSNKSNSPSLNDDVTDYAHQTGKYVSTDSNCFGICKNFNLVLSNSSDSACYLSNGSSNSNSLNPSGLEMKRRALFN